MRALFFLGLCLETLVSSIAAAEPLFTHIHPAGVQAGTTATVTLTGKFDPWPCGIHADAPGLTFTPQKNPGVFELTVDPGVQPRPHLLRAVNAEGASAPVAIMITAEPQIPETEPNDDFIKPQVLDSSIATVNGQLAKTDDVDSFQVSLTQGQTLVVWVEAYLLAAGFDAMLRIVDAHGITLAFNHDGPMTMDPLLVFTAPADGPYIIQIMGHKYPASNKVQFAGGKDCVYRLHVSTGPVVRHAWPLATRASSTGPVMVEGWNLTGNQAPPAACTDSPFTIPHSDITELTETAEAQNLTVPSAVSGRISQPDEEDRYHFSAAKGDKLKLAVSGPAQGSELDAWVKVIDSQGKQLAMNDDAGGSTEPSLIWTAPADGIYTAAVGDLTRQGGPDSYYRLSFTSAVGTVTATAPSSAFKVEAGKTAELKISITFAQDFSTPLKLVARGLPQGLKANEMDVPKKGGEIVLTLTADGGCTPVSHPFQLLLVEEDRSREYPVIYQMISTSENNGVPQGYRKLLINDTSDLWITVTPPPPK